MNSRERLTALSVVLLGACAAHSSALLPLLIEYVIRQRGFSDADAGLLGALGLLGSAISIVLLSLLSIKLQRPSVGLGAAAVLCGANVFCSVVGGLPSLLVGRFVAGLAEGVLISLMTGFIGRSSAPERLVAAFFVTHITLTSIVMGDWSHLIAIRVIGSVMGPFAILAAIGALAGIAAFFYPRAQPMPAQVATAGRPRMHSSSFLAASIGLCGIYLFNVAAMGVWSFVVSFARTTGLADAAIQNMLVVSNFSSFAGAIVPLIVGRGLGSTLPIGFGFASMALVSFSAGFGAPPKLIFVGAQIYSFAWVLLNPYISGAIAALDADGRMVVLSFAALYLGLASGPAITGWLSGAGLPLATVFFGFAFVFAISCATILLMQRLAKTAIAKAV